MVDISSLVPIILVAVRGSNLLFLGLDGTAAGTEEDSGTVMGYMVSMGNVQLWDAWERGWLRAWICNMVCRVCVQYISAL